MYTFPEASTVHTLVWVCQGRRSGPLPLVKHFLGSYWAGDQTPKQRRSEVRVVVTRYHSDLLPPDNVYKRLNLSTTHLPNSKPLQSRNCGPLTGNCKKAHCQGAWLPQLHSKDVKTDPGLHIQHKQGSHIKYKLVSTFKKVFKVLFID